MQKIAKIHNPFDLSEIGEVPFTDWDTVEEFLAEAYHLYRHRAHWQPKHKRITILATLPELCRKSLSSSLC